MMAVSADIIPRLPRNITNSLSASLVRISELCQLQRSHEIRMESK